MVLEVLVVALRLVGALLESEVAFHAFPHLLVVYHRVTDQVASLHLPGPPYMCALPPRRVGGTAMFAGLAGFALSHSASYLRVQVGPIPPEL